MSSRISHKRRDLIAEEAAGWFFELGTADTCLNDAFAAWLKTSPEHVEEFLAVAALWETLPEVSGQPSIVELVALAASDRNIVELGSVVDERRGNDSVGTARRSRALPWLFGMAAVATLAAIMIVGTLSLRTPPVDTNRYTTAIGEQISSPLPDGSLITLNTQSVLQVDYSEGFRDIHLLQGEAFFEVADDASRPFRVITKHAVATAELAF